ADHRHDGRSDPQRPRPPAPRTGPLRRLRGLRLHPPARLLEQLRRELPHLEVVLSVELSATLHRQLRAGELDIILAMRPRARVDSVSFASHELFTEALVWVARPGFDLDVEEYIPLVLYPRPSVTREAALDLLER